MTWRPARSVTDLRDQANAAAPHRSTASDGILGDTAHAATASDHNPNAAGVVCAIDITDDPTNGMPAHQWARALVAAVVAGTVQPPPDLKYMISNRQIVSQTREPWVWRTYSGASPHTEHVHISVGRGPDGQSTAPYDDPTDWHFDLIGPQPTPTPEEDPMYKLFTVDAAAGADGNAIWLVGPKYRHHVSAAELPELVRQFGQSTPCNAVAWNFIRQATDLGPTG